MHNTYSLICSLIQCICYLRGALWYLNLPYNSRGIHSGGLVDRVAPDVENRLAGSDDTANQRPARHPYSQTKVIEGMFVDVFQSLPH